MLDDWQYQMYAFVETGPMVSDFRFF